MIAVVGMRVEFPLLIVVIAAHIGPWQALLPAAAQTRQYARTMASAHQPITAFGGAILMMVALCTFFDADKEVPWMGWIET